jgi:hypothetical protein
MSTYLEFELARRILCVLVIVFWVALVAFAAKNRTLFVAGTVGSLLGFVPSGIVRQINGTGEQIFMAQLGFATSDAFWSALVGAIALGLVAVMFQYGFSRLLRPKLQSPPNSVHQSVS